MGGRVSAPLSRKGYAKRTRYAGGVPKRLKSIFRRSPRFPEGFDGVLVLRHGRPYDPAWDLWRPLRRWPGVLISAVVTAGLLVAIAYHFEHRVAPVKHIFKVPAGQPLLGDYFPPVSSTSPGVQHFEGTTSRFAVPFTSNGALSSWTFTCKCQNNFNVVVHDSHGNLFDIPLNSIGHTKLAAVASYPTGSYRFDVSADAAWSIDLINEANLAVMKTPFSYFSSGTSVLGPFPASSNHLSVGYLGSLGQLLSIHVVDKFNVGYGYPVFTLRPIGTSFTLPHPPAPYYLVVSGVGLWLLNVK